MLERANATPGGQLFRGQVPVVGDGSSLLCKKGALMLHYWERIGPLNRPSGT
jgi:hypothetical protein